MNEFHNSVAAGGQGSAPTKAVFSSGESRAIEGRPVRAGVAGCGYFGGLHAGKYGGFENVELVGVYDIDTEAAARKASELGVRAFDSYDALLSEVDLVSVTAPAVAHHALARKALANGVSALVEKPLARTLAEADELISLAEKTGAVLQVGHQERFVFQHYGLLGRKVKPTHIECRRAGPFTGRGMDVSVVLDLMVHDLDLVHRVTTGPGQVLSADAERVKSDKPDAVSARVAFAGNCMVDLYVSRVAEARERRMKLVYPDGTVEIDFVNRTFRNTTRDRLSAVFAGDADATAADEALLKDPLGFGIRSFVESVRAGTGAAISGHEARAALATALAVEEALDADLSESGVSLIQAGQ